MRYKMKIIKILVIIITAFISFTAINCGNDNGDNMANKGELTYYCPMHPEVTSDKPGVCPICHMDLVIQGSDDEMDEHLDGVISLSDNKLILANVATVKVEKEIFNKTISAYSYLDFAEQNRKLVTARFNGRIEKLFVDKTGDYVKQGSPLFEIYSPDLVQAQNDYLLALENKKNIKLISYSENKDDNPLLKSARKKLQLFGITDSQIDDLEKTGEVKLTSTYYSPMSGTVIEKKVQEGMYVNEGSIVYDIADLSMLWNISEVYENDLAQIKEGDKVQLTFQSYPGETFEGRVSLIYPVVNSQTRTVKIRSLIQNNNYRLKPNMYGETKFETNLGEILVVPEDAVLFTGKRKLIYVKIDEGKFALREIETGSKSGNKYQVVSGLSEGEVIASTGAYLIDSESQLRTGMSTTHQHTDVEMNDTSIIHKRDVKVSTLDKNKDGFLYQCPMDWEVISDEEGSCPLCYMDLEKYSVEEAQKNLVEYP
jgi:Cu(I)/Ag(I) efflux system membrane fusion protein